MKRWGPLSALMDALTTTPKQDTPDEITVVTWNIGNGRWHNIKATLYGWQEAGDQAGFMGQAKRYGVTVYRPDNPTGAASTPVGWDAKTLKGAQPFTHPLYHGGPIGPGTGPDIGKPKVLVGVRGTVNTIPVVMGNIHNYAGQRGNNKRAVISHNMVKEAVGYLSGFDGVRILTGDFNQTPRGYSTEPLVNAGWVSLQQRHTVPTHGASWAPDQIWVKGTPFFSITGMSQTVRNTGSDHMALINIFQIKAKS